MSSRVLLLALALVLGASPAFAQQAPGPRRAVPLTSLRVADRPVAQVAPARRPGSRYPLIGTALGVVAGIGYGAYLHSRIEPGTGLAGPPAYFLTVPLGAVGGLVLGMVANSVHPPSHD